MLLLRQLALGGKGKCRSCWRADWGVGVRQSALNVWGLLPHMGLSLSGLWKGSHPTASMSWWFGAQWDLGDMDLEDAWAGV